MIEVSSLISTTIGFLVLLAGKRLNGQYAFLQKLSIPEPVTGGLLAALILSAIHSLLQVGINFDLEARDFLLVYFFTIIGINASFSDLCKGGRSVLILVGLLFVFMLAQNILGISMASALKLPQSTGLLAGTVSLIGGHGETIAWASTFVERFEIANAMEIGLATSTLGLIIASGGPIPEASLSSLWFQHSSWN
ncbi:MAG: sodium/glutamate symporter [Prochlorococcus sp.]